MGTGDSDRIKEMTATSLVTALALVLTLTLHS
jgi:hypothetical protein